MYIVVDNNRRLINNDYYVKKSIADDIARKYGDGAYVVEMFVY